jgi:TetR/AcrR family transcriptional repressor of nem operon
MVGRPREFDPEIVLDAAMQAFWTKGYEATSLTDLMEATGLHKGSLYQAFGDKHALFIRVLKRYLSEMRRQKNEIFRAAPNPVEGLRSVMHGMLDIADDDCSCPKGCLAINSVVELAPHDPEVRIVMDDHMQRMRQSLVDALTRAVEEGQIGLKRSPEVVAALMMTFMAGLATRLKSGLSKPDAHALLDTQLESLM